VNLKEPIDISQIKKCLKAIPRLKFSRQKVQKKLLIVRKIVVCLEHEECRLIGDGMVMWL
jgi:hypothetical protein